MSEDGNVLSQTVSSLIPKITGIETRLNAHEAAMNTILARVERLEDGRANAAKPEAAPSTLWRSVADAAMTERHKVMAERDEAQKRLAEVTANLAATQAEYRRVEEERNASWASERTLRNKVCEAGAKCEQALRDAAETKKLLEDARREVQSHAKNRFEALNKKLGRLFDSLFAGEDDLTDETREFWCSLESSGWLRPSRVAEIVNMKEAAQTDLRKFKTDENTLRAQLLERVQYLENAAGDQRERVRELMQQAAEASEQARLARIAEDTQRVEKEKALDRVQYLEKALANLSTAHEGLLADKEKALADKEHAVCPHCHKCATCGTA